MRRIFAPLLITLLVVAFAAVPAFAATYALQVEFIANGVHASDGTLLAGGKVWTYEASSFTPKSLWLDRDKTSVASNPVVLDGQGRANVYADGIYKFVIQTSAGLAVRTMDDMAYTDTASGSTFSSAVTITSTSVPQMRINNGPYFSKETVAAAGGMHTVETAAGTTLKSTTGPQLTLDNGTQNVTMNVDATSHLEVNNQIEATGLTLSSGGNTATLTPSATNALTVAESLIISTAGDTVALTSVGGGLALDGPIKLSYGGNTSYLYSTATDTLTVTGPLTISQGANSATLTVPSAGLITTTNSFSAADITASGNFIAGQSFEPASYTGTAAFTAGTGWTMSDSARWFRYGTTSDGRVFMSGVFTAGATATTLLGAVNAGINLRPISDGAMVLCHGHKAGDGLGVFRAGNLEFYASGAVYFTWNDGSAIANGDIVYCHGLVYPIRM